MRQSVSQIRVVIAIALCALAILFAVEAKVAGYHPDPTFASGIRAAKAWAGESQRGVTARPVPAKQEALAASFSPSLMMALLSSGSRCARPQTGSLVALPRMDASAVNLYRRPPPAV